MDRFDLDAKDRQLLYALDRNARQPVSQLAKKIHLSQPAVTHRLQRLVKRGIVRGFSTVLNVSKLGYTVYRVYIRYRKVDPKKEAEIVDYFSAHPRVFWFGSLSGRWDMEILIFAQNFFEFTSIFNSIRSRWEEYIGSHVLSMAMYNYHFKRGYLSNEKERDDVPEAFYGGEPEKARGIDGTDLKILKRLATNARTPTIDIARNAGISENTAKYRIKKLERSGVIQTYRLWMDPSRIGYELCKTILSFQNLTEEKEKAILRFCRDMPNVLYLIRCAGPWDMELEWEVSGSEEYRKLLLEFRKVFSDSLKDYETILVYREHKMNYFPMKME